MIASHHLANGAVVVVADLDSSQLPLMGTEVDVVRDALLPRVRDFVGGRTAMRHGLVALGTNACEIGVGVGGEPVLPRGLCGSISHAMGHVVALVARKERFASVGIDINDSRRVGVRAAREITWSTEVALVQQQGFADDDEEAFQFIFSAKEAVFKCQYACTGSRDLQFQQVRLTRSRPGALSVGGWRVSRKVATVLRSIEVSATVVEGVRIVSAIIPAGEN